MRFIQRLWSKRHTLRELFRHEHRFVVMDTNTYKEKMSFKLSGLNLFVGVGVVALVLVVLTAVLLAFTPLRELIPGYTNAKMVKQTYENAKVIRTLEEEIASQESLLADIQDALAGRDPSARHEVSGSVHDTAHIEQTPYVRSHADTLLRNEIESRGGDKYYASPLQGTVLKKFDSQHKRYNIEIEGKDGEKVVSIQTGAVILAEEKGHEVQMMIYHQGGDISTYRSRGKLLKAIGDEVDAGEPIIQIKDEKKDGKVPVEFALIKGGVATDPQEYISFSK